MNNLTIGVITDIQYADQDDTPRRPYRNVLNKLPQAFGDLIQSNPDFILCLGDIVDRKIESFDALTDYWPADVPMRSVLGNHDYSGIDPKDYPKVINWLGIPSRYYDFSINEYRFVMLDSNDLLAGDQKTGRSITTKLVAQLSEKGQNNAYSWNGFIGDEQLMWLESVLQDANIKNQKVIICCHNAVYPNLGNRMLNDIEVLSVLDKYENIIAYFAGHDHDGGYGLRNNVHHITFKAILDYVDQTAYSIMHITDNSIEITGFGRERSRSLKLL